MDIGTLKSEIESFLMFHYIDMKFESIKQEKFKIFSGNELKNPTFSFGGNYITDGVGVKAHMCDSFGTMTANGGDGPYGPMTVRVNDTYNDGY